MRLLKELVAKRTSIEQRKIDLILIFTFSSFYKTCSVRQRNHGDALDMLEQNATALCTLLIDYTFTSNRIDIDIYVLLLPFVFDGWAECQAYRKKALANRLP